MHVLVLYSKEVYGNCMEFLENALHGEPAWHFSLHLAVGRLPFNFTVKLTIQSDLSYISSDVML